MYLTETQVYEHKINVMWSGVSSLIILFDVNSVFGMVFGVFVLLQLLFY